MKNKQFLIFSLFLAWLAGGCTATTVSSSSSGAVSNTTAASTATTAATISVTTATLNSSTGCITNVNTAISSDLPGWATDNFKCQVAYTSGSSYVFKSSNWPNHKSFYYCGSHANASTTCNPGQSNANL